MAAPTAPIYVPHWPMTTNDQSYNDATMARDVAYHTVFPIDMQHIMLCTPEVHATEFGASLYRANSAGMSFLRRYQKLETTVQELLKECDELRLRKDILLHEKEQHFMKEQNLDKKVKLLTLEKDRFEEQLQKMREEIEFLHLQYGTLETPGPFVKDMIAALEAELANLVSDEMAAAWSKGLKDARKILRMDYPDFDTSCLDLDGPS